MDDTTSCGHPLYVTGMNDTFVPKTVAMFHRAGKDVGNRLDAPVWMPGKAFKVVAGVIGAEIVEEKKWVKLGHLVVTEGAFKVDPRPLYGWLAFPDLLDLPYRLHIILPEIRNFLPMDCEFSYIGY